MKYKLVTIIFVLSWFAIVWASQRPNSTQAAIVIESMGTPHSDDSSFEYRITNESDRIVRVSFDTMVEIEGDWTLQSGGCLVQSFRILSKASHAHIVQIPKYGDNWRLVVQCSYVRSTFASFVHETLNALKFPDLKLQSFRATGPVMRRNDA